MGTPSPAPRSPEFPGLDPVGARAPQRARPQERGDGGPARLQLSPWFHARVTGRRKKAPTRQVSVRWWVTRFCQTR